MRLWLYGTQHQQRCRVVTTVSIQLGFDLSHFVFTVALNSIIENEFRHPHRHYEAMYVLKWHVDVAIVLRQFSILLRCDHFDTPGGVGLRNVTRIDYRKLRDIGHHRE
jgi:hypothetical protein